MAPKRNPRSSAAGHGRRLANGASAGGKNASKVKSHDNAVPDVFQEMLAEVESSENDIAGVVRATKRRRVGERPTREPQASSTYLSKQSPPSENPQTVTFDSEDSDESEFEWEDVGLASDHVKTDDEVTPAEVSVVLNDKQSDHKSKSTPGRRAVTSAERNMRLDVHKMHVCCLLHHVFLRNAFCNDQHAQVCRPISSVELD